MFKITSVLLPWPALKCTEQRQEAVHVPLARIEQGITKLWLVGALSYWEKVIKITKQNSVCAGVYRNVGGLSKSSSLQFCAMQNIIALL